MFRNEEPDNRKTADIFIRFPFCAHGHALCTELTFDAGPERVRRYIDALKREMETAAYDLAGTHIRSVTIGGGSPLLLEAGEISSLLQTARSVFEVDANAQITIESEPHLLRSDGMIRLQNLRVDRLLIRLLTGRHSDYTRYRLPGNLGTAQTALMLPQLFSIPSYAPVILYGLPGQSAENFLVSARFCCKFNAPEVIFERFVPTRHALYQALDLPDHRLPDEASAAAVTGKARQHLLEKGYLEYRPDHFALPNAIPIQESGQIPGRETADLLGFGVNCLSRSEGIIFRSTGILPRYLAHAGEPEMIYQVAVDETEAASD